MTTSKPNKIIAKELKKIKHFLKTNDLNIRIKTPPTKPATDTTKTPKICPFYFEECTHPENLHCESDYGNCPEFSRLSFLIRNPIPIVCPFFQLQNDCIKNCNSQYIDSDGDYRTCPKFAKQFYNLLAAYTAEKLAQPPAPRTRVTT